PLIVLGGEPVQPRGQRRLRAQLTLEARIVEHHEPALGVRRDAGPAEQMIGADDDRRQTLVGAETVDAITVLLAEEEILRSRIQGETAERVLSGPVREGD